MMSTALATQKQQDSLLFTVTAETIEPLREKYLALKINGIDDTEGAALVRRARLDCVKARTTCEKEHRSAKEDALRECQRIDKSKRDLLALIAPIETHLEAQEAAVESEKLEIDRKRQDAIYRDRVAKLDEHGCSAPESYLRSLAPAQFAEFLANKIQEKRDRERIEAERAELAAERAKLDAQRQAQEAEAARLQQIEDDRLAAERAEQRRIADERLQAEADERERVRREQAAKEMAEAVERERIATEARIKREAEEAESERLREEALKPDREKMLDFAKRLAEMPVPMIGSESIRKTVEQIVQVAVRQIRVAAAAKGS